jgi:hypothetical protein
MNVMEMFKKEIGQVARAVEKRVEIRGVRKGMYAGAATLKELDPGRLDEYSRIIQILDGTKPEDEGG